MKKLYTLNQKMNLKHFLVSFFLMALFMGIILPYEANLLNDYLNGISAPDTRFFYTSDTLYHIASVLGEEGRNAYIISRLRFDIAWPLVYSLFFYTSITLLFKQSIHLNKLLFLVVLAFIFDILENTVVSTVFYLYPNEIILLPYLAGFMTMFKWITITLSFVFIGIGIIVWLKKE